MAESSVGMILCMRVTVIMFYFWCVVYNMVLNIKTAVFLEFQKMLVVDKVELAVTQKELCIGITADQVCFGYRHMRKSHNSLQTITTILHFA